VEADDLGVLFEGIGKGDGLVRITRLRADLAHSALSADLVLTASSDQSILTNQRKATHETGEPSCPIYDPGNCSQVGTAPRSQATSGKKDFSCATTAEPATWTLSVGLVAALAALFGARRARRAER